MENLETVIEDAITDATLPVEPTETSDSSVDLAPSEPIESTPEASSDPVEASQAPTPVASPAAKAQDDFDKKYGIPAQSASGRENRIPYSRVKKITDNAVKDAKTAWSKELQSGYVPVAKVREYEAKVKDFETRFKAVNEFEKIMTTDQPRFLQMLANVPGYAELLNRSQSQPNQPEAQVVDPDADMPQPDQPLSDGSMVYSMDGVRALNAWNRAQGKKEVMSEVEARIKAIEARYAPLENDYKSYQTVQAVLPKVQQQIADARTWTLFNESEAEIVKALEVNPSWNLERAYQQVVFPKLQANRDRMRADILREVKQAPRSTSAPTSVSRSSQAPTGPRSLEDIITESIKGLR